MVYQNSAGFKSLACMIIQSKVEGLGVYGVKKLTPYSELKSEKKVQFRDAALFASNAKINIFEKIGPEEACEMK